MPFLHSSGPTLPATVLRAVAAPQDQPVVPDRATLEAHLTRSRYGRFTLTEAIRPGWQLDVVPQAGFRHDAYVDPRTGSRMPAVIAAVSSEDLFSTFLELLEPLGDSCDVVLESSHDSKDQRRGGAGAQTSPLSERDLRGPDALQDGRKGRRHGRGARGGHQAAACSRRMA